MRFIVSSGEFNDNSFSLGNSKRSREGVEVSAKLPSEIEKAVFMVSEYFKINPVPVASLDFGGHGSAGLIFTERRGIRRGEDRNTDFDVNGLMARISFGPPDEVHQKIETNGWNPKKMGRFHIGVYGGRQFFPEDFQKLEQKEFGIVSPDLAKVKEIILFSWRYEEGKFDDWNNLDLWFADRESNIFGGKGFHEMRTTYLDSEAQFDSRNKSESLKEHLSHFGRKKIAFPLNLPFEEYTKTLSDKYLEPDLLKMWRRQHSDGNVPITGYGPALKLLSKFGDVSDADLERIPVFSPMQAVEYTFGNILRAVDSFVNS